MTDAGITQITDDIVQVRIPLPYRLNIVNCYLLRGAAGWTLLDTGLNTAAARAQWGAAMKTLNFKPDDIEKIVLTHMHPDHFGLAGWWQQQAETPMPVYLPEREMPQANVFYRRANTPLYHQWMLDCGMDEATVGNVERALGSTRDLTQPHPVQGRRPCAKAVPSAWADAIAAPSMRPATAMVNSSSITKPSA